MTEFLIEVAYNWPFTFAGCVIYNITAKKKWSARLFLSDLVLSATAALIVTAIFEALNI